MEVVEEEFSARLLSPFPAVHHSECIILSASVGVRVSQQTQEAALNSRKRCLSSRRQMPAKTRYFAPFLREPAGRAAFRGEFTEEPQSFELCAGRFETSRIANTGSAGQRRSEPVNETPVREDAFNETPVREDAFNETPVREILFNKTPVAPGSSVPPRIPALLRKTRLKLRQARITLNGSVAGGSEQRYVLPS